MVLRPFKLKLSPLLFGAILAAASSVEAQRAATNAWQSIIFSSPSNSTNLSNPRSVTTQSAPPSNLGNLFQDTSPVPAFNDLGPAPVPSVGMRLKKSSDRNGNWVFMTPAEIMGVAPDQILQTQNGSAGADDQQGSLTPMERYLAGRNPSAANNAYAFGNRFVARSILGTGNNQTNGVFPNSISSSSENSQPSAFSQPLNDSPDGNFFANPNGDSGSSVWSKLFGAIGTQAPPQPAVKNTEQQADMNQFQRLLDPDSASTTAATTMSDKPVSFGAQSSFNAQATFGSQQAIQPNSDSIQPFANSIGTAFAPLSDSIGQPEGIAPLPGITPQAGIQQPSITPAWAPQSAPWMSSTPQPFAIPQRKF